jgi:hypothetical protein
MHRARFDGQAAFFERLTFDRLSRRTEFVSLFDAVPVFGVDSSTRKTHIPPNAILEFRLSIRISRLLVLAGALVGLERSRSRMTVAARTASAPMLPSLAHFSSELA